MAEKQQERPRRIRRSAVLAAILFVVTLLAAAGSVYWSSHSGHGTGRPANSILVVLPFDDRGANANEHLGQLVAEDLVTDLGAAGSSTLQVMAYETTARLSGASGSPAEIAGRVGATHALRGSIERSGERIRLDLQVIRASDDRPLWAESFVTVEPGLERSEAAVVEGVISAITGSAATTRTSVIRAANPDARAAWRDGRSILASGGNGAAVRAIERFTEATKIDPGFSRAWERLAATSLQTHNAAQRLGVIKEALDNATEHNPRLVDAWIDLGAVSLYYDWNWAAARLAIDRALSIDASSPRAHATAATLDSISGHFESARDHLTRALALDPLSPSIRSSLGLNAFWDRRWNDARKELEETLRLFPGDLGARAALVDTLVEAKDFEGARDEALELMRRSHASESAVDAVKEATGDDAIRLYLEWNVARARLAIDKGEPAEAQLGVFLARLGRNDEAIAWLETALTRRSPYMPFIGVDPQLDSLRDDPDFQRLCTRAGVPEIPRERLSG